MAQRLYFGLACQVFRLLANNAAHALYDYEPVLRDFGLHTERTRDFALFGVGPRWYRTWVARRSAIPST